MYRILQLAFFCLLISCKNESESHTSSAEDPKSNDILFLQRSYPSGTIDPEGYKTARQYRQEKLAAQSSRQILSAWEFSGPTNIGGRITDVEILRSQPNTFYAAAASGGIFKSVNSGNSWTPIFDDELALAIGDMAIAPSNEEIIYAGTGEPNAGGGSIAYDGYGVYRSDNGGNTWNHLGLEDVGSVGKIIVHPTNPDIAYVAAMGHLFAKGPDRGLYRTTNGGQQWEKILFINDSTGMIDLAIHPENPDILYACAWQRVRKAGSRIYGGISSGIYKSTNGGDTWQKLTSGLPESAGRIGIAISPSSPNMLYAMVEQEISGYLKGVYTSENDGINWSRLTTTEIHDPPYMYWFGKIYVHPTDPQTVYLTSLDMFKSTNGGNNWAETFSFVHADQHAIAFHPEDPETVLIGNDGGVYLSHDGGDSWIHLNTLPITQFYTCEIDYSFPERLYGGAQDNGTVRTLTGNSSNWNRIYYGDGFRVRVDPTDNNYVYAEYQYGEFARSINGGLSFQPGLNGVSSSDRFNWNTPYILDPNQPEILYLGSHRLYKSEDRAVTWNAISPDLAQAPSHIGFEVGTITTISVSPVNPQIIYVGTDNGNVQVTTDGGTNWTLVSGSLPDRWVTSVLADPKDELTAYVTFSGYRYGESVSHIYKTIDAGASWIDISGDLPDMPVNEIIVTPALGNLYIATDIGVLNSTDGGLHWELVGTDMPNLVITDLTYHDEENLLVAATYGRGMYRIHPEDEITSTSQLTIEQDFNLNAFPNPFRDQITIECRLQLKQWITIELVDISGKTILSIFKGELTKGIHYFNQNANAIPEGMYYCCMKGEIQSNQAVILVWKY
jgi:photosystem II stability/assembly factor-like uncharacterized protein